MYILKYESIKIRSLGLLVNRERREALEFSGYLVRLAIKTILIKIELSNFIFFSFRFNFPHQKKKIKWTKPVRSAHFLRVRNHFLNRAIID